MDLQLNYCMVHFVEKPSFGEQMHCSGQMTQLVEYEIDAQCSEPAVDFAIAAEILASVPAAGGARFCTSQLKKHSAAFFR